MTNLNPPSSGSSTAGVTRAGTFMKVTAGSEPFRAFSPKPLPPNPPLDFDDALEGLLDRANQGLGRLDGVTLLLPDPEGFIYSYVRKEAVLSSQIEGTQSSLSDLLLAEQGATPGVPGEDIAVTSNYVAAMNHGLKRLEEGFPLSLRLIKEIHEILLAGVRGSTQTPGEFRRTQNWIGGSRPGNAFFVPPPAHEVMPAMGALERFLHNDRVQTRPLIKAALAHAQFETIHPFLDGNGRIGRLLITLLLCDEGILQRPLLYLSLYLKAHRTDYYDHLQRVRVEGAWEAWIKFFLEAVAAVSEEATITTQRIVEVVSVDRQAILGLGRAAGTAMAVHDYATKHVVLSVPRAAGALTVTEPPIYNAVRKLETLGILHEVTGQMRNRLYVYRKYLDLLLTDQVAKPPR